MKQRQVREDCLEFGEVKYPVLLIPVIHAPDLVIGRRSGRAILEHLDQIRQFVVKNEITRYAIEQICQRGLSDEY